MFPMILSILVNPRVSSLDVEFNARNGDISKVYGIPVVSFKDLIGLGGGGGGGVEAAKSSIIRASKDTGLFYLTDCGILCSLTGIEGGENGQ